MVFAVMTFHFFYCFNRNRMKYWIANAFFSLQDAFSRKEFSGRPGIYSGTFFQKGKSGVSTTEGEHWEAQRGFLHARMVEMASGPGFHDAVMDEVHDLKSEFAKRVRTYIFPAYFFGLHSISNARFESQD